MNPTASTHPTLTLQEREAVYQTIFTRRDIRKFKPDPLPIAALTRILAAAHAAPSVGFMQPWNFIMIQSTETRQAVKESFARTNEQAASRVPESERKSLYTSLKLEGILESPLNIAVTCDHQRDAPFVLGRESMPQTDLFSVCCAIQNLWLAARAEEVGVGWVSILEPEAISALLGLPEHVELVAYLCVGYPVEFAAQPELQTYGWKNRQPLEDLVFSEKWNSQINSSLASTIAAYRERGTVED